MSAIYFVLGENVNFLGTLFNSVLIFFNELDLFDIVISVTRQYQALYDNGISNIYSGVHLFKETYS